MMRRFSVFVLLALLSLQSALCDYTSESSPSLAPEPSEDSPSPVSGSPLPSPPSPPAPSPTDLSGAPTPSPATSPSPSPSPAPAPAAKDASEVNHDDVPANDESKSSSGGMSGGRKAGIAVGVLAAAGVVGLGAYVYKKRNQNIRRSEYSYAARREFL